jgi:hypothetical protein
MIRALLKLDCSHVASPMCGWGRHIEAVSNKKLRRPHLIEKVQRTNHLPLVAGQSAADFEAVAQIAALAER